MKRKHRRVHRRGMRCFFIGLAFLTGIFFSYESYHTETYPNGWPGAISSKKLAEYMNEHAGKNDKVLISEFEYWNMPLCPVFIYYWDKAPLRIVRPGEKAEDLTSEIKKEKISWLIIVDSPVKQSKTRPLAESFSSYTGREPVKVGWAYVWDVKGLWKNE